MGSEPERLAAMNTYIKRKCGHFESIKTPSEYLSMLLVLWEEQGVLCKKCAKK